MAYLSVFMLACGHWDLGCGFLALVFNHDVDLVASSRKLVQEPDASSFASVDVLSTGGTTTASARASSEAFTGGDPFESEFEPGLWLTCPGLWKLEAFGNSGPNFNCCWVRNGECCGQCCCGVDKQGCKRR